MKVINKPIEMISYHTTAGEITPLRFRMIDGDDTCVIKVNHVLDQAREKSLGREVVRFTCVSTVDGIEKRYELRFYPANTLWKLYKM